MSIHVNSNPVHLAAILAEADNPNSYAHKEPIRAKWFRELLANCIANNRQSLDFFARNPHLGTPEHIAAKHARIATCESAIKQLEA